MNRVQLEIIGHIATQVPFYRDIGTLEPNLLRPIFI